MMINENPSEQLDKYLRELLVWNRKFNLTSITDENEIRVKHFEDSKTLTKAYDFSKKDLKIIDIGAGAGFPGMVIKILFPDIRLTLLDSVRKKTEFMRHIANILCLKDVDVVWARAEDYAQNKREYFDVAVARALADLRVSAELCLPFVNIGGVFIAMKSENIGEEVDTAGRTIAELGGRLKEIIDTTIEGNAASGLPPIRRKLVMIEKISETPEKFPRKAGIAKKRPL